MTLNDVILRYKLSIKDLVDITATTQANVRKIIKGERVGKFQVYMRLQRALKLSNEDIYDIWLERSMTYEKYLKENA